MDDVNPHVENGDLWINDTVSTSYVTNNLEGVTNIKAINEGRISETEEEHV